MFHVVLWDPRGEQLPGGLVTGDDMMMRLRGAGVATLPVEPELMQMGGDAGYSQKFWGAGWPMVDGAPRRMCFMKMYAFGDVPHLHWQARLVPTGAKIAGNVGLVADAGQRGVQLANVEAAERSRVDLSKLTAADAHGGWTVGGTCFVRQLMEGPAAFALWGAGTGIAVQWMALTQTRRI